MNFTPVLPFSGYGGWAFLKRTMPSQTATFAKGPELKRDEDYFRAKIGAISTADALVADRRLLKVALGAFGLDGDIANKAFIRKVLAEGTLTDGAFVNRLADKAYQKLSAAFGFGDFATPRSKDTAFPDKILTAYRARQFEAAVGQQNGDLRLGLNTERELAALAAKTGTSENGKWFTIMGNPPLRRVFEQALGLPASLAAIDIDQQLTIFKDKAQAQFGDAGVSQFSDPVKVEKLIRRFLIRSEATALASEVGPNAAALQMLTQTAAFARQRFT